MATAAHPGWASTGIQKNAPIFRLLSPVFAQSAAMGALPTLRAGFDPRAEPAAYYGPGGFMTSRGDPVRQRSNPLSHDEGNARRLWALSEEMTGVRFTP